MDKPLRVLVVEDSEDDTLMLLRELRRGGYEASSERVETPDGLRSALARQPWDVVVADWSMPQFSARAALSIVKESGLDLPFLILSGVVGDEDAVAAMKAGAHDYIPKGNLARLVPAIERELRENEIRRRQRRLEEALDRSSKLEVVGRFAGQVGGEFQEALSTIGYWSAWLAQGIPESAPLRDAVSRIQQATERAGNLARQLLLLSHTEVFTPAPVDLNDVIDSNLELLRAVVGEGISLTTSLESGMAKVQSDHSQLEQLIVNLVTHARQSTGQDGSVEISTWTAELDGAYVPQLTELKPGRYAALTVRDTGEGIARQLLARVFEPFLAALPGGRDTGLSLALVYSIVKQNGGDVAVASEPGRGSAFTVYLPLAGQGD